MMGKILEKYREENGLTPAEMAGEIGVPLQLYMDFEAAKCFDDIERVTVPWPSVVAIRQLTGAGIMELLTYNHTEREEVNRIKNYRKFKREQAKKRQMDKQILQ